MPPETFHQVVPKPPDCTVVQAFVLTARAHLEAHQMQHVTIAILLIAVGVCLARAILAGNHAHSWQHQPLWARVLFLLPLTPWLTLSVPRPAAHMSSLLRRQSAGVTQDSAVLCVLSVETSSLEFLEFLFCICYF